jgi:outer membrane protein assembly factor BamB
VDGLARNWPGELKLRPFWTQFFLMGIAPRPSPPSGYLWRLKIDREATSSPAAKDGVIYLGSGKNLVSVDLTAQQKKWTFEADSTIESSPALSGNNVYAATWSGRLYSVDITSGRKNWDLPLGGKITSSPAIANGMLYVGSTDGNLYAVK